MKRRLFIILPILLGVGSFLGGCATTGGALTSYDPNKPQTFLAGAQVEQAKSLAMGSAVTKGWKVVDSSGNRLVVRRPLSPQAAQSVTGEPVSTAVIEVKSDFFERQGGVDVVVGAAMVANAGTKSQRKIDFTKSYKDDLNRSLNSLQNAWNENRWRVASATPPLPTKLTAPKDEGTAGTPPATQPEQTADSGYLPEPKQDVPSAAVAAPAAATTAATSSVAGGAAPVEDRYATRTPPPVTPASPANNMLVLNRQGEQGVWTYYAEHYAKIRGCQLSDAGAVLQEKTPEFEVHRVYCEDEKTFLVRCNAGACRGLE